ncbi:MAG: outer membrane beta-barrel protein [Sphingobacteriales bacterium]
MKKLFLLITLIGCAVIAKAQSSQYHSFKVDLTVGYAIPPSTSSSAGDKIKAGVTFGVEPHYRLSDAIAVGLRIEGAGLAYGNTNGSGTGTSSGANVSVIYSYCPSIEYYLLKGGFRPFIGAGAGIFDQGSVSISGSDQGTNNTGYVSLGSKFGFFPRAGFEAGHFRISAEYNILGNDANGNSSSYAAFNLGFFFGGGKK